MNTSSSSKNKMILAPQQSLHFYKNDHLATEVATLGNRHVLWANEVALAQLDQSQTTEMLRVDLANSVLGLASGSMAYSPYGYLSSEKLQALLGFNGQRCDPGTQSYPLGAGRRMYSPTRMRFCSNDPSSPFEKGGLNPTAYCEGDPINRHDPTGQFYQLIKVLTGRIASRAVTNFGRSINFATSGISRNPTPVDPQLQSTYSAISKLARSNGSLNTSQVIPLPSGSRPRSFTPAPPSNVTAPETTALISSPAPLQNTQTQSSALTQGIQKEQILNRMAYNRKDNSDFAAISMAGFALVFGGGVAALYFGLKAIRKD